MWYQVALIVLTALFSIIFAVFKDKAYYVISVISIDIMVLQYCGNWNSSMAGDMNLPAHTEELLNISL